MPEQIGTPAMHFPSYVPPETLEKYIVVVAICSGMGAKNSIV